MRFRTFRGILDECLESVRRGESADSCLERYPKHAERLRPLLELAARVQRVPATQARPWAQATAWDVVRQRAAELRGGKRRPAIRTSAGLGLWLRPLAVAMALVFAIFAGGGATALASQSALPDSPLYRVKLFTEDVQLWFVFDDSREAEILLDQSDERMDEVLTMARKGKTIPANVLSAMEDRHERAADIVIDLDPAHEDRSTLELRLLEQSASQEDALLALWDDVSPGGRDEYAQVVATLHNTQLGDATELVLSANDLIDGVREIEGEALLSDGAWTIAGIEVSVDERAIGQQLISGATARGIFGQASDGTLRALSLISFGSPPAIVFGEIEEVTADGIRIAGRWIPFNSLVIPELKVGDRVEIELEESDTGTVASKVSGAEPPDNAADDRSLRFVGTIESEVVGADSVIISGVTFTTTQSTKISASAATYERGARVLVQAAFSGGVLTAQNITILDSEAVADDIFIAGTFDGIRSGLWDVSGIGVKPPVDAAEPEVGSLVSVDVRRTGTELEATGYVVVERPGEDPVAVFSATILDLTGNRWDIGIGDLGDVRVNPSALVVGDPDVGDQVLLWGRNSNVGVLQATYVRVLD